MAELKLSLLADTAPFAKCFSTGDLLVALGGQTGTWWGHWECREGIGAALQRAWGLGRALSCAEG